MPITLNAGAIETFTLGGSTVATHDTEAISTSQTDYLGLTMTVVFAQGTPASNSFATDARAKTHTLNIDLATGKWNTSVGTQGTLPGATLTSLQNNQRALKNGLENIANSISPALIPGTVVAWT